MQVLEVEDERRMAELLQQTLHEEVHRVANWSKYLCGTGVVVQQTAQSRPPLNGRSDVWLQRRRREQQDVTFALVIAFSMIVLQKFRQDSPQRGLPKQD